MRHSELEAQFLNTLKNHSRLLLHKDPNNAEIAIEFPDLKQTLAFAESFDILYKLTTAASDSKNQSPSQLIHNFCNACRASNNPIEPYTDFRPEASKRPDEAFFLTFSFPSDLTLINAAKSLFDLLQHIYQN